MLSFLLGSAVLGILYSIMSVSLNMQAGETGLMNFGLIAFFGVGAYSTGIGSMHDIPWPLSILLGMIIASVLGAACGYLAGNLGTVYWALATLAVAELIRLVINNASGVTGGPGGISSVKPLFGSLHGNTYDEAWLGIATLALAVCAFVSIMIRRSQAGRVLRMIREHQDVAASLGHNVLAAKVRVMAVSAPMAAVAGSLYTHYLTFIGPQQLEPFWTFLVFTMLVVGGMGNVVGAIIGGVLVELVYDLTRFLGDLTGLSPATAGGLRILVIGVILLAFLHLRPTGLLPERPRRRRCSTQQELKNASAV